MDRIHRLGQHRPVQAIKLVIEDSIESRIIQLQEKKSAMVDATLSTDDSAMGRLIPQDLGFLFRVRNACPCLRDAGSDLLLSSYKSPSMPFSRGHKVRLDISISLYTPGLRLSQIALLTFLNRLAA